MMRCELGKAVVDSCVPSWRLHLFVALRRFTPLRAVLLSTSVIVSVVLPVHLAPARTFTMTVTVLDLNSASPLPIAAIQVFGGDCLLAEATPSPAGSAAFVLPAGEYTASAQTNADGRVAGWALGRVAVRLDRDLDVAIDHEVVPPPDLDFVRTAPPARCPAFVH